MTKWMTIVAAMAWAGCAKEVVSAPIEAPILPVQVAQVAPVAPLPEPDAPRDTTVKFPAGPGVALMSDQFTALVRARQVTNPALSYEERLALAEKELGKGTPITDPTLEGTSWLGVGGRSVVTPFTCSEFVIAKKAPSWTIRQADNGRCGLPYATDETKPYVGLATRRTLIRLEELLGEVGTLAPTVAEQKAHAKLGTADAHEGSEALWAGLGPRGKDAPISCFVLRVGAAPRVEAAPLATCGLAWPMPSMTFEKGPEEPPIDKQAKLSECATKCATNEICMIDQRVPYTANVRVETDGSHARYPDGRPAKVALVASCVPVPPSCAAPTNACFFPQVQPGSPPSTQSFAGPCPKDGHGGHSFLNKPNHIMCYSRTGLPPAPPPPSKPSAAPPPRPSSSPPLPIPPRLF